MNQPYGSVPGGTQSQPSLIEIERETLFLDAYGMAVSPIVVEYGVNQRTSLTNQGNLVADVAAALAADGWTLGGTGFFSMVFVKDGFALKVGVKSDDTGAMYAAWCRANQSLPGVPRIYGITKFTGCYLVLMKRYQKVPERLLDEEESPVSQIASTFQACRRALRGLPCIGQDDVVATAKAIGEFFKGVADIDLHGENVMLDGANLVLTDPLSYGPCSLTAGGYSTYETYGYGTRDNH